MSPRVSILRRSVSRLACAAALLGAIGSGVRNSVAAVSINDWTGAASTSWTTVSATPASSNWTINNVPNSNTEAIRFSSSWSNTARMPTIGNSNYTLAGVIFGATAPAAATINAGSGTISLDVSQGGTDGTNSVGIDNQGTLQNTINARLALINSQTWENSNASGGSVLLMNTVNLSTFALSITNVSAASYFYLGGVASGSGSVAVSGDGSLVYTGAQAWTGSTTVNSGSTLTSFSGGTLSNSTAVTINSGGTWDLANTSDTVASIAGGGTITLGSATLTTAGTGSTTFSGDITGTGGLTKQGTGTLTLSGTGNTFSGATTINNGTLALGADGALPTGTNVTVSSNVTGATATLDLAGNDASIGTLTLAGSSTTSTANVSTGAGMLTLGGNVTYTATNNPQGSTISGNLNLGGATRTFTIGNSTTAANDLTVSANISGTGAGIIKSGTGTLVLSGVNTFDGGVTLNASAGILAINSSTALGAGSGTFVINGSVIDNTSGGAITLVNDNAQTWAGNFTFTGTNDLNLGSGQVTMTANRIVTVTNAGRSLTVGGITDGASSFTLTKAGSGTLVLSGAGDYGGLTTVSAGILQVENATGLGATTGATSVTAGATLAVNNVAGGDINENITINGVGMNSAGALLNVAGTNTLGGTITMGSTSYIGATAGTMILGGVLTDGASNFALTKVGAGTVVLGNANTYDGLTTVSVGTLQIENATSLGTTGSGTTVTAGATLALNNITGGSVAEGITINGAGVDSAGALRNVAGTNTISSGVILGANSTIGSDSGTLTLSGVLTDGAGSFALVKEGSGVLVLDNANTFDGLTTVNAGILRIQNNTALGTTTGATTIASGGTLELNSGGSLSVGEAFTISGAGSGPGSIVNAGGTNTISGIVSLAADATIGSTGGGLTLSNTIQRSGTGSRTVTFDSGSGSISVTGAINNTIADLVKIGAGTTTLSNASNAYTGATTINGGTLVLGASNALPAGTAVTVNGTSAGTSSLDLAGFNNTIASLTFGGSGGNAGAANNVTTGAGTLTLAGNVAYDATGNQGTSLISGNLNLGTGARTFNIADSSGTGTELNITAAIANTVGGIVKTGLGNLQLSSGSNAYSGATTINLGTVSLGAANALPSASAVTINSTTAGTTALLDLNGYNATINSITFGGAGGTTTSTNNISTGAGTLTLGGNVAYSTASSNQLGSTISGLLSLGGSTRTFTVDNSTSTASELTIAANIANTAGGIIKAGDGTMILSGTNAFTGATTVNNGILQLNSSSALGGSTAAATVTNGGTLALEGGVTTSVARTVNITGTGEGGAGALRSNSGNNFWTGGVTLGGAATIVSANAGDTLTIGDYSTPPALVLGGHAITFDGAGNTTLWVDIGPGSAGSLIKDGTGTLRMNGIANAYTGSTLVNNGSLILDNDNSTIDKAILGNLTIGDGSGLDNSAIVKYGSGSADNKIANTSLVTINSDGKLDLNNRNDTIGSFLLSGGQIDTGTGVVTLAGNVSSSTNLAGDTSFINGNLNLGAATRTFTVANGGLASDLTINARVTSGSIIKSGLGVMTLSNDNTIGYGGTTQVSQGTLVIQNSGSLGQNGNNDTAKGTTVDNGATLRIDGTSVAVGQETLSLSGTGASGATGALVSHAGTNSWSGQVTLAGSATVATSSGSTLVLSGDITGTTQTLTVNAVGATTLSGAIATGTGGLIKTGSGTLTLSGSGANTYTGTTSVNEGTLVLNKGAGVDAIGTGTLNIGDGLAGAATVRLDQNNQIANSTAVTIASDGTLDLNGKTETLGSIAGSGTLAIGSGGSLTLGGTANTTFSGLITGTATSSLIKDVTSTGTLTLTNNNLNFGGNVTVNGGTLEFAALGPLNIGGTLTLGAGSTLKLSGTMLTATSINITGNTTIDFGGASLSILNTTTLTIDPGVTLVSIINWVNDNGSGAGDRWFATNWTGATPGTRGTGPELQVTFSGYTNSATAWMSYDNQITPAPEPATYGLIFSGLATALVALRRRFRKSK